RKNEVGWRSSDSDHGARTASGVPSTMPIRIAVIATFERVRQATVSVASAPKASASTQATGANAAAMVSRNALVQAERVDPTRPGPPIAWLAVVTISGSSATATAVP